MTLLAAAIGEHPAAIIREFIRVAPRASIPAVMSPSLTSVGGCAILDPMGSDETNRYQRHGTDVTARDDISGDVGPLPRDR
jgi:hypothetical protein